uniref:PiggyBac transposable element-derived protein domain-containing protein n=1 Tax=Rhodnius prolixus TaxID=13249 RepID=T1IF40_RHOPR
MTLEPGIRRMNGERILTKTQFDNAFIGLLFARSAYNAQNVRYCPFPWNKKWGRAFFSNTMSRNVETEILRFIRVDQRNNRLQTDKFALISKFWNKFVENSQNCS